MTTKARSKLKIDRQDLEYVIQYCKDQGVHKFTITADTISVEFNPYLEILKRERDQATEIPQDPEARKSFLADEAKRMLRENAELENWSV